MPLSRQSIGALVGAAAAITIVCGFVPGRVGPADLRLSSFTAQQARTCPILKASPISGTSGMYMVEGASGKVLVSGFLDAKERTDQLVFDVLHAQGLWEKIVAFSPQTSFAKKRLVSRTARYSGLMDVLQFEEGDRYDAAVMTEKLAGCDAWLCFNCDATKIKEQVDVAKAAGVKKLVITSEMPAAEAASADIVDALEASGLEYTFIRTGAIKEGKEGGAFMTMEVGEELPVEEVNREDAARMAAEAFRIEVASKKAFTLGKGNDLSAEYLKIMREKGMDRKAEFAAMIAGGLVEFQANKTAEELIKNPPPEDEEVKAARIKAAQEARAIANREAFKEMDIRRRETMNQKARDDAKGWLQREFVQTRWRRSSDISEEDYCNDPENLKRAFKFNRKIIKKDKDGNEIIVDDDNWEIDYDADGDDKKTADKAKPKAPASK